MSKVDYYKILQVDPKASQDQIRQNYHKLALEYHPDKQNYQKYLANCEEKAKMLMQAYSVLKDPESRQEYDFQRTMEQNGSKNHFFNQFQPPKPKPPTTNPDHNKKSTSTSA